MMNHRQSLMPPAGFPSRNWDATPWAIPWIFTGLLSLLTVCVTASDTVPVLLSVGEVTGVALAVFAAIRLLRRGAPAIPEIGLFWLFVLWCGMTGYSKVGLDFEFLTQMKRLLENGLILLVVSAYCASKRSLAPSLVASIAVALVLTAYGFQSGDFQLASEVRQRGNELVGSRAESLSGNANSLGMLCFYGIAALVSFWGQARSRIIKLSLLACVPPLLAGILFSASRKSFLLVFVFLLAWGWLCFRKTFRRNLRVILGFMALGVVSYFVVTMVLENTLLGQRLRQTEQQSDTSTVTRIDLSREAAAFFLSSPLAGIGLGQMFRRSVYALYAHSEYMEVLATTGAVGAALYFSIYLLLWRRLGRLRTTSPDGSERYAAGCCLAMLVCYFVASPALVSFISMPFFCLISGLIGYAYGAEARLKSLRSRSGPRRLPSALVKREAYGWLKGHDQTVRGF